MAPSLRAQRGNPYSGTELLIIKQWCWDIFLDNISIVMYIFLDVKIYGDNKVTNKDSNNIPSDLGFWLAQGSCMIALSILVTLSYFSHDNVDFDLDDETYAAAVSGALDDTDVDKITSQMVENFNKIVREQGAKDQNLRVLRYNEETNTLSLVEESVRVEENLITPNLD